MKFTLKSEDSDAGKNYILTVSSPGSERVKKTDHMITEYEDDEEVAHYNFTIDGNHDGVFHGIPPELAA